MGHYYGIYIYNGIITGFARIGQRDPVVCTENPCFKVVKKASLRIKSDGDGGREASGTGNPDQPTPRARLSRKAIPTTLTVWPKSLF